MDYRFRKSDRKIALKPKRFGEMRYLDNVFTTRMEPGAQAAKYPRPVRLVGPRNPAIAVEYTGNFTDADNIIPVATLRKEDNAQWKNFDIGQLPLEFSYLGLGIDSNSHNDAYNQQFVDQMKQAISAAFATQLTDLAALNCKYQTDMPKMNTLDNSAGFAGMTVWYQSMVQGVASIMAKFKTIRMESNYLIDMGYSYEAPYTMELTNLFKKKEFQSLFDQLGVILQQEYFDVDYYKDVNILNALPSRLANDAQNPLLSIVGVTHIPDIRIKSSDGSVTLFSTFASDTGAPGVQQFNNIAVTVNGVTLTFPKVEDLIFHICAKLDPLTVVGACRQRAGGVASAQTAVEYLNEIIACMKALIAVYNTFKNYTIDFKTFLMVLQDRTQLNKWMLNTPYVKPSMPTYDMEPAFFATVHDIFRACGTCGPLIRDNNTMKWRVTSMWREASGIPAYDLKEGGFIIGTSVRAVPANSGGNYDDPMYMFPVWFRRMKYLGTTRYQQFLNRRGYLFEMGVTDLNAQQIAASSYFARLNSLNDSTVAMQVPTVTQTSLTSDKVLMACINKLLMRVFGVGRGIYGSGSGAITNDNVDSDVVMIVGREFGDYAENAVSFLTSRMPLRESSEYMSVGFETKVNKV